MRTATLTFWLAAGTLLGACGEHDPELGTVGPEADAGSSGSGGGSGGTCEADFKQCSAECVSVSDPEFGCDPGACEPCDLANATATCSKSACAVGACTGGFENCDSDPKNGCETSLAVPSPGFPCEIDAILEAKCRRCHTSPTANGAPFPLLTWENTHEMYVGKPIFQRMHAAVDSGFMPFVALKLTPPVEPLEPAEKDTLLAWLADCAKPADGAVCP